MRKNAVIAVLVQLTSSYDAPLTDTRNYGLQ